MCSRSLNKLAQPLPMAHCANSRLVCKISGDVMNENNPPMMLPNGYVYGYNVSGHRGHVLKGRGPRGREGRAAGRGPWCCLGRRVPGVVPGRGPWLGAPGAGCGQLGPALSLESGLAVEKPQGQGGRAGGPPGGSVQDGSESSRSGGWGCAPERFGVRVGALTRWPRCFSVSPVYPSR